MKKHLVLYNKMVKAELLVKGLAKMKKEQIEKEFNENFKLFTGSQSGRKGYIPKDKSGFSPEYDEKDFYKLYEDAYPAEKKAAAKPAAKKVTRKTKDGKVKEAKKEEIHPDGIHLHIDWKDGEKELKKFKTAKQGETAFKKIRAERKEKRNYKQMKLMDGKKSLEYSA